MASKLEQIFICIHNPYRSFYPCNFHSTVYLKDKIQNNKQIERLHPKNIYLVFRVEKLDPFSLIRTKFKKKNSSRFLKDNQGTMPFNILPVTHNRMKC